MAKIDEAKMEMRLHWVHCRFFLNAFTHSVTLFSKQGKKGINQDAMLRRLGEEVAVTDFRRRGDDGHSADTDCRGEGEIGPARRWLKHSPSVVVLSSSWRWRRRLAALSAAVTGSSFTLIISFKPLICEKCLKEVRACVECKGVEGGEILCLFGLLYKEFEEEDKVVINGSEEEVDALREKMEEERAKAVKDKKPKMGKNGGEVGVVVNGGGEEGVVEVERISRDGRNFFYFFIY
ncbi:hypothetical protein Tsubulata_009243 [Turnera subulata]|uniref:Uncharacterized protein n=1 Tax=Turnera subulata TaxID=218843 RepID=A0A9Q0G1T3_9ROSI|nr:hypothetical protein Tsubulata_009243 [Turnera subulata]